MDDRSKGEGSELAGAGVALSSIQTYLSGKTIPTLPFVREAGSVLGVRPAWLALGDGWPTDEEESARALERFSATPPDDPTAVPPVPSRLHGIGQAIALGKATDALAGRMPGFWDLPAPTRAAVIRGFNQYRQLPFALELLCAPEQGGDPDPFEAGLDTLATRYALYLSAAFSILGLNRDALGPVGHALIIDAQLRAIELARHAPWPGIPEPAPRTE